MTKYFIEYKEVEDLLKLAKTKEERDILLSIALDFSYDNPQEFYELVRLGLPRYRELLQLKLMTEKVVNIIARIHTYKVDFKNRLIKAKLENGLEVLIPLNVLLKDFGNIEKAWEALSNPLGMELEYSKEGIVATYVYVFEKVTDVEKAEELTKEFADIPALAFVAGLGIMPTYASLRQFLPRMLPLVRVFYKDFNPLIHVIQLTGYNTGKTTYASRLMYLMNAGYFQGIPRPAALVFDGSRLIKGAVFTKDMIVIDEIDKQARTIKSNDQAVQETLNTMVSGLENGIWTRGVRGAEFLQSERRYVPFLLMGNTERPLEMGESVREYVKQAILERLYPDGAGALEQRFTLMDMCLDSFSITAHLTYKYLPNSIMRGLIAIAEKRANEYEIEPEGVELNRYAIHAVKVAKALYGWLGIEVPFKDAYRAVVQAGFDAFAEYLVKLTQEQKVIDALKKFFK